MKKKVLIIFIAIMVLLTSILMFLGKKAETDLNNLLSITIEIFNENDEILFSKEINTKEKYLSDVIENTDDLNAKLADSDYGKYITSLVNIDGNDDYYWGYYINDEYATVGISNCELVDDAKYTFKYEKIEY